LALAFASAASCQESLVIGPGDVLHVRVLDSPELDETPRVTDSGEIPIAGIGSVKVAGLIPTIAASRIRQALINWHYLNHPEVLVTVEQYTTESVSVLGQVKTPGAYNISTGRSVLDILSMAGGLLDTADHHIVIERHGGAGKIVKYDLSNDPRKAIEGQVQVFPGDTILVPKAGIVYILGDVNRPGGFVMGDTTSQLTILQAVTLAGGTARSAVPSHARIIRKNSDGTYKTIPTNFSAIQKGNKPDVLLHPDDVVYVPFSYARNLFADPSSIAGSVASAGIYAIP
jgi:polysaccharide export outer membrane protein